MTISDDILERHGLTREEFQRIVDALKREPTLTELGIFSVMWSEHCSYKSSRVHLKTLPTTGPRVLQGPGENAGAVDIGDGLAAVFKIESHNHPSFIEPYQGAATGVGGIIRDIFTIGARPIALLNSRRIGPLEDPLVRLTLVGIQDMGAAGLTCSTCEMGSRGGAGVDIDVSLVPQRETGMTPYEIMLSESQERMLMVVKRGREAEVEEIFEKWDLHAVRVGEVTTDGRLRVRNHGEVAAEIPNRSLTHDAPAYRRPRSIHASIPLGRPRSQS